MAEDQNINHYIGDANSTKSKQKKVPSFAAEFMDNRANVHPHSKLPKEKLQLIKLRNKCICIVDGLPKDITVDELKSEEWYGGFNVIKIEIKKLKTKKRDNSTMNASAWITFPHPRPRDDAIQYTNNMYFEDGRVLKATHGYNHYCKHFINNKKCTKKNCEDHHEWIQDVSMDSGIYSYNSWIKYLSRPCGILSDPMQSTLNFVPRYDFYDFYA